MIGIKIQNLIWEKTLLELLDNNAEKYQMNHHYDIVISDKKISANCMVLGKDISLPFCFDALNDKINQLKKPHFENNFYKWISQSRQLIRKNDNTIVQLTEKESEIISFLVQCPQYKSTKEKILKAVWHYKNDVHTHTLESHIYTLRQKLAQDADKLINTENSFYTLIS